MIDYFLVTHNLDLIETFPKNYIPNLSILLVGNDNIKYKHNAILCNNLKYNIENKSNLCSYTGWYAVSKNKLYTNQIVCLLEYDINITNIFHQFNLNLLQHTNSIIAYSYTLFDHYVFYKSVPWLEISLKKTYNIDLKCFVNDYKNQYLYWPTTTNITMNSTTLNNFVEWFTPMTKYFEHDSMGAYVHERAFFIFCVINNINILYSNPRHKILTHHQKQSHGINDVYGKFLKQHNTTILTDCMLEDYDKLYEIEMRRCLLTIL